MPERMFFLVMAALLWGSISEKHRQTRTGTSPAAAVAAAATRAGSAGGGSVAPPATGDGWTAPDSFGGYMKCTEAGLTDLLSNRRQAVENFYIQFQREVQAQADAAVRNLWLGTPKPTNLVGMEDLSVGNGGCLHDARPDRLSDVYFAAWRNTHVFDAAIPIARKAAGGKGTEWTNPLAQNATKPGTDVIGDYCNVHMPHCPTAAALSSGVDFDYMAWHYKGAGGERGWTLTGNKSCPTYCLLPNRFNNSFTNFHLQVSDGPELRWHELNSNLFGGGLNLVDYAGDASGTKFHQGMGWAWFYKSWQGLFRFIPELQTLFGASWGDIAGGDYVWPFAYEAFPPANPEKVTVWTMPYFDAAWQKFQVSALAPVYDGPNKEFFLGIIGVDVFMDSTKEIVDTLHPTPNSQMMLVSAKYDIIFATATLYNTLFCPGHHLCRACNKTKDGEACLAEHEGTNETYLNTEKMEANADSFSFQSAQFVSEADEARLRAATKEFTATSSFERINLGTNRQRTRRGQCLGSPSCSYLFLHQRFEAQNMNWTMILVVPEEDLAEATGVQLRTTELPRSHLNDTHSMGDPLRVTIENSGRLPLSWAKATTSPHLQFPVENGIVKPHSSVDVEVRVDGRNLAPGMHMFAASISVEDTLEGSCLSRQLTPQVPVTRMSANMTCGPGKYLDRNTASCLECLPGTAKNVTGTDCTTCLAGSYTDAYGSLECKLCPARYACPKGTSEPEACPRGAFTNAAGREVCTLCERGSFQDGIGQSECRRCPTGMTTGAEGARDLIACVCKDKQFHRCTGESCRVGKRAPDQSFCSDCLKGMECTGPPENPTAMTPHVVGGVEWHRQPKVLEKTMAIGEAVYRCSGDGSACPGAFWDADESTMCNHGGTGVACSLCPSGHNFDGNRCKKCKTVEPMIGQIVFALAFLVFCGIIARSTFPPEPADRTTIRTLQVKSHNAVGAAAITLALNFVQMTWIFVRTDTIKWPKATKELLLVPNGAFDLSALSLSCLDSNHKQLAVTRTAVMNTLPAFVLLILGTMYCLGKFTPRRSTPSWPDPSEAKSAAAAIFNTFFLVIANSAINSGFAITKHPTGDSTLRYFPYILTSDPEAHAIQAISVVGIIVWCVAGLTVILYLLVKMPQKMDDIHFRRSTLAITIRYRPDCPWWFVVVLLEKLLLALSMTFFGEGVWQMGFMLLVLAVYETLLVSFRPYQYPSMYYMEVTCTLGAILMLICAVPHQFEDGGGDAVVLFVTTTVYALVLLQVCWGACIWARFRILGRPSELETTMHDLGGRLTWMARLPKTGPISDLVPGVAGHGKDQEEPQNSPVEECETAKF